MKPRPRKPKIIIAQVAGSGMAETETASMRIPPLQQPLAPSFSVNDKRVEELFAVNVSVEMLGVKSNPLFALSRNKF